LEANRAGTSPAGELVRIAFTGNQRLDHRPAALAHDVRDHRVELDIGELLKLWTNAS